MIRGLRFLGIGLFVLLAARVGRAQSLTEGFDDITTLPAAGWVQTNHSEPLGISSWFQGTLAFPAQAGAANSYIAANYQNTAGAGTISNWLLTPTRTFVDGDTVSFWTRAPAAPTYPDRLELRMSTNGSSSDVGTTSTDVGDFTVLMLSVNPTLITNGAPGGYPTTWTEFTGTVSGVPVPTSGRFALRYFVTNGGPSGANSTFIGIDSFAFTTSTPVELTTFDAD